MSPELTKALEDMPDAAYANRVRLQLLGRALHKHGEHGPLATLANCHKRARCRMDGCPSCLRVFRRSLLKCSEQLGLSGGVWTRASLVLTDMDAPPNALASLNVARLKGRVERAIQRSRFASSIVMGGIDFSLNCFDNVESHWQGHVYLLINAPLTPELEQAIQSAFSGSHLATRWCELAQVRNGDFFRVLSYAHKDTFYRRSGYHENRTTVDGSPRRNNRPLALSAAHSLQAAEAMVRYPVGTRLILHGLQRTRKRDGGLRLRLMRLPIVPR